MILGCRNGKLCWFGVEGEGVEEWQLRRGERRCYGGRLADGFDGLVQALEGLDC